MHKYFLIHNGQRIFLYTDIAPYKSEAECLNRYEDGLASGQYSFNRSKINQVWSELMTWGLVGRSYPIELLKVLCANGANIESSQNNLILQKSFAPVKYVVPVQQNELEIIKPILKLSLGLISDVSLECFYWSENKLNFGVFYIATDENADSNFPKYCNLIEKEMLLPANEVHKIISRLFNLGFKIVAEHKNISEIIAHFDLNNKIIYGIHSQDTIAYLADN